jgi:hypothetical protein
MITNTSGNLLVRKLENKNKPQKQLRVLLILLNLLKQLIIYFLMKNVFRSMAAIAILGFATVSCGKSCEEKAEDFVAAASTYTSAIDAGDCDAIKSAWTGYSNAFNDLCDESKSDINWEEQTAAYELLLGIVCAE